MKCMYPPPHRCCQMAVMLMEALAPFGHKYRYIYMNICIHLRLVSISHCNLPQDQIVLKFLKLY